MLEEQLYREVEFVIIDELHMIMDEGRGHLIENLISKLRFLEKVKGSKVQLIAMSATMGGLDKLQMWLNTSIYQCNFRPVPLNEYFLSKGVLRTAKAALMDVSQAATIKNQHSTESLIPGDRDSSGLLAGAYMRMNKAVLVFCPSKNQCEETATKMAKWVPRFTIDSEFTCIEEAIHQHIKTIHFQQNCQVPADIAEERAKLVNELENCPSGLCEVLAATIPFGVAYHHSGLTPEEREIVERGYRRGLIMVLCATSTLSTGINLPAKAVIFRGGPTIAKDKMDAAKYK